jgi:hypothetical protein
MAFSLACACRASKAVPAKPSGCLLRQIELKMNDTPLNGDGDRFGSIGDTKLGQNVLKIPFGRVFGDV